MSQSSKEQKEHPNKLPCRIYNGPLLSTIERTYKEVFARVLVGEEGYVVPCSYPEMQDNYDNFEVRPDDIFVISMAKAGTTWTQELVWCVLHGLNHERGSELLINRFPFFEWDSFVKSRKGKTKLRSDYAVATVHTVGANWDNIINMKGQRLIKSHFPKELLPRQLWDEKSKIVYVCRDPRDVCVSFYYHSLKLDGYIGTLHEFVDIFLGDIMYFCPYWPHVLGFWKMRNEENVLFIRYEELKADLPGMIRKVANFFGKNLNHEEVVQMEKHLTFDTMKKNPAVNYEKLELISTEKSSNIKFMRKGKVGDWREHFDDATVQRFKEWTERGLENSDFPYYRDYD